MIRARSLFGCLMGLILLFGSVMGAVARNEQAGLTTVTLCGADGAAIQIDAQGNPVEVGHACPECVAAAAMVALDAPPAALALAWIGRVAFHLRAEGQVRQSNRLTPVARGPPDWV
jgi:hypothetical protein